MKITFYRQGYANNSSSSHSLIFTREDESKRSDESYEFGWRHFTCSAREDKLNYLYICLHESWFSLFRYQNIADNVIDNNLKEDYEDISWNLFIHKYFPIFYETKKYIKFHYEEERYSYVDHQSVFTFPCYRDVDKGINIEFANDFINEVVNKNYVILGGNDNEEDNGHKLKYLDTSEHDDVKLLYRCLAEHSPKDIICVKDDKTGEYVISLLKNGNLMKVKFN